MDITVAKFGSAVMIVLVDPNFSTALYLPALQYIRCLNRVDLKYTLV